jgi:hypothetical protein
MFKSFLPKMIAIPASVLPVAFLPSVGYTAPPPGTIVDQPASVTFYLCFMIGGVSTFICCLSAICKLRFPRKTAAQCDAIGLGVALHNVGKPAPDPLSNEEKMFELRKLHHKAEADQANLLDYFRGLSVTHQMLGVAEGVEVDGYTEGPTETQFMENKKRIALELRSGYIVQLVLCILFTIFMAVMVAVSVAAGFLSGKFDWVPTMLM